MKWLPVLLSAHLILATTCHVKTCHFKCNFSLSLFCLFLLLHVDESVCSKKCFKSKCLLQIWFLTSLFLPSIITVALPSSLITTIVVAFHELMIRCKYDDCASNCREMMRVSKTKDDPWIVVLIHVESKRVCNWRDPHFEWERTFLFVCGLSFSFTHSFLIYCVQQIN